MDERWLRLRTSRDAARWLTEAQGPDGTWTYDCGLPKTLFAAQKATAVKSRDSRPRDTEQGGFR